MDASLTAILKTTNGDSGNGNGEWGTGNEESLKWGIFKSGNLQNGESLKAGTFKMENL